MHKAQRHYQKLLQDAHHSGIRVWEICGSQSLTLSRWLRWCQFSRPCSIRWGDSWALAADVNLNSAVRF